MAVRASRPDFKEKVSEKAEELAERTYGREFNDLPPSIQMRVWMDAEQEVINDLACQADAIYDRMKEEQLFGGGNGHRPQAEREEHWADLELGRRQGK